MPVPTQFGVYAATAAAATATTWSPTDKSANITLSNGDLTATLSGSAVNSLVRGTTSHTSGKWHFEIEVFTTGPFRPGLGVANPSQGLGTALGTTYDSVSYYGNGQVFINNVVVATLTAFGPGDVIAVEVDLDNNLIFYQKVSGLRSSGIDISSISGAKFPALGLLYANEKSSGNFGAAPFYITPTAGFSAWG